MYVSNVKAAHGTLYIIYKIQKWKWHPIWLQSSILKFKNSASFRFLFFNRIELKRNVWRFFLFSFPFPYSDIHNNQRQNPYEKTHDWWLTCHTTFLAIYTFWLIIIHIRCLHVSFFLRLLLYVILELPIKYYYYHYLPTELSQTKAVILNSSLLSPFHIGFLFCKYQMVALATATCKYRYLKAKLLLTLYLTTLTLTVYGKRMNKTILRFPISFYAII